MTESKADPRLFFKLHNGFPEHPKAVELSDKAFRQLIEAWCYCSRNLNDGQLTQAQFLKLFSQKSRKEVLTVGFVTESELGYEMHDYLLHQQSAEQVETRRITRKLAGSKGGKARANNLANAKQTLKQTGSKVQADIDTDIDTPTYVGVVKSPNATNGSRNNPGEMGTRIPPNFTATPQMIRWAQDNAPNVNLALATQKFKAHHRSVAGRAQFKTDWTAAWEAWLLSDQQRALDRPQQFKTAAEKNLEAGARRHARLLAQAQINQQELEA